MKIIFKWQPQLTITILILAAVASHAQTASGAAEPTGRNSPIQASQAQPAMLQSQTGSDSARQQSVQRDLSADETKKALLDKGASAAQSTGDSSTPPVAKANSEPE